MHTGEKRMDDLISRRAAILETWREPKYTDPLNILTEMRDRLINLPSEEPKIIRCKDCRHSVDEYDDGDCYCLRPERHLMWVGDWNFFCKAAERRQDV